MIKRLCLLSLLGSLMCGVWGCISYYSDHIEESDVPGVYYASFGSLERDYIELKPDSSYVHHYEAPDGQIFSDTGNYLFRDRGHTTYGILLKGFKRRHPQIGGCLRESPEAIIDTTPVNLPLSYYKIGKMYAMDYCPGKNQVYKRGRPRKDSE